MRENAARLSRIWHDRPMPPLDTAIYWVERAARLGHVPNTGTMAKHLPLYQLALLDVAATILIILVTILAILYFILRLLLKTFIFNKKIKEKDH